MAASKVCHDPRRPLKAVGRVDTVESGRGGILHLAKNERDTRISCTRYQATATCAAFVEESRMKFVNANKLRRKSGQGLERRPRVHLSSLRDSFNIGLCRVAVSRQRGRA